MNILRFKQLFLVSGFAGILILLSGQSAQAESLPPEVTPGTAPTQTITPGRATRSGSSYVGVDGNIGFGGRTDLGRGSFTAFSKIGLTFQ